MKLILSTIVCVLLLNVVGILSNVTNLNSKK